MIVSSNTYTQSVQIGYALKSSLMSQTVIDTGELAEVTDVWTQWALQTNCKPEEVHMQLRLSTTSS